MGGLVGRLRKRDAEITMKAQGTGDKHNRQAYFTIIPKHDYNIAIP